MPVIDQFQVKPGRIAPGGAVEIAWKCSGPVKWVKVGQGERVVVKNAPHSGKHQDRPSGSGQLKYWIIVYNPEEKWVRKDAVVTVG